MARQNYQSIYTGQQIDQRLTDVSNKVDKVTGKGLSANDYTNEDKALVQSVPDKMDKALTAVVGNIPLFDIEGGLFDDGIVPTDFESAGTADAKVDAHNASAAAHGGVTGKVTAIEGKIPSQASGANQLADKEFVNSSINAMAAFYITADASGNAFATKAALLAGPYYSMGQVRVLTKNDYALVNADETHEGAACRYVYDGAIWAYQYKVNDTPFTAAQLAAINSGISAGLIPSGTTSTNKLTNASDVDAAIAAGHNAVYLTYSAALRYADVKAAVDAGKAVFLKSNNIIYTCYGLNDTTKQAFFIFSQAVGSGAARHTFMYVKENEAPTSYFANAQLVLVAGEGISIAKDGQTISAPKEIFMATYGTTTYADIVAAYNAGKEVMVARGSKYYHLYAAYADNCYFSAMYGTDAKKMYVSTANAWSEEEMSLENAGNKVTTLSGESTDAQYPSAKCVYDELQDKADKATSEALTYASGAAYTLAANEIATLDASAAVSGDAISIAVPASPAVTDCFDIMITLGAVVPTINFPSGIKWLGGSAPTFAANKVYEINVMNGLWVSGEF